MSDEPKGRAKRELLPTVECSSCGAGVRQTKPSRTGLHFCKEPECQRAKGREAYRSRAVSAAVQEQNLVVLLVQTLALSPRVECQICGLLDALPNYAHPDRTGIPCRALGTTRMGGLAPRLIEAIWPRERRVYADGPATMVEPG